MTVVLSVERGGSFVQAMPARESSSTVKSCGIAAHAEREFYKDFVDQIARSLLHGATNSQDGILWLSIPEQGAPEETQNFYDGNAGIAYFLLKAYVATGERGDLNAAKKALDHMWARTKRDRNGVYFDEAVNGLFEGNAGPAYVFLYAYHVTGQHKYLKQSIELAARMLKVPDTGEKGSTDIISGAAGAGLFLLKLHEVTRDRDYLQGAQGLGDFLINKAELTGEGAKWPLFWRESGHTGHYPGFSHGVAGIGYYLSRLSLASKDPRFAEYAEKAQRYLEDIAVNENDVAKWYTDEDKFKARFPAQWCHGAGGMNPFFVERFRTTGNEAGLNWAKRGTGYMLNRGLAAQQNASVCHGVSGNAASLLSVYRETCDPRYAEEIRAAVTLLNETAKRNGESIDWESPRFKTDFSYMTGIAGVGDFFILLSSDGKQNMMMGLGYGDDF